MLECLLRRESLLDLPLQALVDKINKKVIFRFHHFWETFGVGQSNSTFGVRILERTIVVIKEHLSPGGKNNHGSWWYTLDFHNALYLLFFVFSCKNRESHIQLIEYTAQ